MSVRWRFLLLAVAWFAIGASPRGQTAKGETAKNETGPADRQGIEFFEKRVRPVFVQHCYQCHSNSAQKVKGGLKLDSRAGLLAGGAEGAVVVPGKPDKSRLVQAIGYEDKSLQMPPKSRLPKSAVEDIAKWVRMGAPFPADKSAGTIAGAAPAELRNVEGVAYETLRKTHWAWQPVKPVTPPVVKSTSWPLTDVDRFLLAKMESAGVTPVGDADRATLIRRATLDLTGLPPTPADVQAFFSDADPAAFEKVVDRLLASSAFGERWGRHWLDVARYAESTGFSPNIPYPDAWRYRDYVIDSLNRDKPFNRFVTEQLAGDLLPYSNAAQRDEQLIATGFLAIGVKDLNEKSKLQFQMDVIDEQIDVLGRAVLGSTISCARCHDHKFDPVSTQEYYSLAGIFRARRCLPACSAKARTSSIAVPIR